MISSSSMDSDVHPAEFPQSAVNTEYILCQTIDCSYSEHQTHQKPNELAMAEMDITHMKCFRC